MKGPAGFAAWLTQMRVPMPLLFAWVVSLLETAGAGLLILGLATRFVALGFAIDMLGAIRLVKRGMARKRFMEPDGTGWEFEYALLVAALALIFTGAGAYSADRLIGFF